MGQGFAAGLAFGDGVVHDTNDGCGGEWPLYVDGGYGGVRAEFFDYDGCGGWLYGGDGD